MCKYSSRFSNFYDEFGKYVNFRENLDEDTSWEETEPINPYLQLQGLRNINVKNQENPAFEPRLSCKCWL